MPVTQVGQRAEAVGHDLHSYRVGLLPIVNRILERLRLEEFFRGIYHRKTAAAASIRPPGSWSCSRTCSCPASPSTASASGRRGTPPTCSGSPIGKSPRSMTIAWDGVSTACSRTTAVPSP